MIELSERDLQMGVVITPGWYAMNIKGITEGPSKDGGSTNYTVEGEILKAEDGSEQFKGNIVTWNFNSKAIGFAAGFLKAFGVDVKAGRWELNNAVGKQLLVMVENDTYNGRIVNRVNHKYRQLGA